MKSKIPLWAGGVFKSLLSWTGRLFPPAPRCCRGLGQGSRFSSLAWPEEEQERVQPGGKSPLHHQPWRTSQGSQVQAALELTFCFIPLPLGFLSSKAPCDVTSQLDVFCMDWKTAQEQGWVSPGPGYPYAVVWLVLNDHLLWRVAARGKSGLVQTCLGPRPDLSTN